MRFRPAAVLILAAACAPAAAFAQDAPRASVDLSSGYAAFVDDSRIDHGWVGGAFRWRLSRRVSVGPELVYMIGPRGDRDVFVTGKVLVDFMPARRVSPYFVADGGVMFHRDEFLSGAFWSREAAGSVGGGVRVDVTDRVFVAPEVRIGWEPHIRVGVLAGFQLAGPR